MSKEETLFLTAGNKFKNAEQSRMFGKPCFKVNGKAFICFFQNEMAFKLRGDDHKAAIGLKDSQLFDLSGKKRPMKEWVQVPSVHSGKWEKFAGAALNYVKENS